MESIQKKTCTSDVNVAGEFKNYCEAVIKSRRGVRQLQKKIESLKSISP